jgi:hypothetical protein
MVHQKAVQSATDTAKLSDDDGWWLLLCMAELVNFTLKGNKRSIRRQTRPLLGHRRTCS